MPASSRHQLHRCRYRRPNHLNRRANRSNHRRPREAARATQLAPPAAAAIAVWPWRRRRQGRTATSAYVEGGARAAVVSGGGGGGSAQFRTARPSAELISLPQKQLCLEPVRGVPSSGSTTRTHTLTPHACVSCGPYTGTDGGEDPGTPTVHTTAGGPLAARTSGGGAAPRAVVGLRVGAGGMAARGGTLGAVHGCMGGALDNGLAAAGLGDSMTGGAGSWRVADGGLRCVHQWNACGAVRGRDPNQPPTPTDPTNPQPQAWRARCAAWALAAAPSPPTPAASPAGRLAPSEVLGPMLCCRIQLTSLLVCAAMQGV
jgi:hypothetical protein